MPNQQPPPRVWLQIGAGMDGYGLNATWHSEPIGEPDLEEVEYVRVDHVAKDLDRMASALLSDASGYHGTSKDALRERLRNVRMVAVDLKTLHAELRAPQTQEVDHG